jgi:LPXTG-site transpeptidase (sortase) family protein
VLLFVAYELVGTNLTEEHNQAALAREFSAAVAQAPSTPDPAGAQTPSTTSGRPTKRPPTKTPPTTGPLTKSGRHAKPDPAGRHKSAPVLTGVALPIPPPGGAVDHLVIPAIGVNRYVVQGVAENDLQEGPGHYPGTPLPGQPGNVGIAGHRTTFGAPFFRLNEVVPGDLIYLTDTSGTTWVYTVQREWVVAPTSVGVLDPTHKAELTLTTCNPRFEAISRLVVRAQLAARLGRGTKLAGHLPVTISTAHYPKAPTPAAGGTTATAPTTRPAPTTSKPAPTTSRPAPTTSRPAPTTSTAAPAGSGGSGPAGADSPTVGSGQESEALVTGGTPTWLAVSGWAALAVVAWVATRLLAVRKYRYAKVMVLLSGGLVCLVPLWFTFENAVNLLPANF